MAQYSVPQFIERESKILGPLTGKQVIILGVTAAILFVLYFIISNFFIYSLIGVVILVVGLVLTFAKINGRPLSKMVFSFLGYFLKPKMYVWKRGKNIQTKPKRKPEPKKQPDKEKVEEDEGPPSQEEIKNLADYLNK